ncbi:MAG TPA: molybdate ABC transporter substrate-binding protein [Telluria sp.]|nr:molybdate ABC transporter substrate-binding protein [Telluria sp.]
MKSNVFSKCIVASTLAIAAGSAPAADLTVSAASSLTNAFRDIAADYEAQHPGSKIALNFGGSGALLQQLAKGAPVDVFACADQETMDTAQQQGLVKPADRRNFVRNTLVLIVPTDSSAPIRTLEDLTQSTVKRIAIGMPASVPVGRYSKHALAAKGLWPRVEAKAIHTQNVRQSLDYVARGEVDAGFVYATDAAVMQDKVKVAFEVPLDTAISYPIAQTAASTNAAEAERFIGYVLSPPAQAVLGKYGFRKP